MKKLPLVLIVLFSINALCQTITETAAGLQTVANDINIEVTC
ncbi:MAG: hypothetical protein ABIN01_05380 [Ferruginibacter sp.]